MQARVIATRYPQLEGGDPQTAIRHRRAFGDIIEVTEEEFARGVAAHALQSVDDQAPGPDVHNSVAAAEAGLATQPDGQPVTDEEGEPLDIAAGTTAPAGESSDEWKAPRTHAEADDELTALGISAPEKATVKEKAAMIEEYRAAQTSGETLAPLASEDISELDDGELIQRGVDFGLAEEELVELSHDALVLKVAEAMNRQSRDPAEQERLKTELPALREQNTAANNPQE